MRIKHRYSFNSNRSEIIYFLDSKNIKYKKELILTTFEIFEDNISWKEVQKMMKSNNLTAVIDKEYTKNEILSAEWLQIRSKWRWEYPQPEDDYKSITFDDTNYCSKCGKGLVQKSSFQIKKEPKWGTKSFLQLFWIEDELFVKNEIAEQLKQTNLQGFSFQPVLHYKKNEELKTIKQIEITNIYHDKLIFKENEIKKKVVCPECKNIKYVLFGNVIIKANKKILNECSFDIVKTEDVFGDGLMAARYIFISNRFAKYILERKLKDVVLEPIQLE